MSSRLNTCVNHYAFGSSILHNFHSAKTIFSREQQLSSQKCRCRKSLHRCDNLVRLSPAIMAFLYYQGTSQFWEISSFLCLHRSVLCLKQPFIFKYTYLIELVFFSLNNVLPEKNCEYILYKCEYYPLHDPRIEKFQSYNSEVSLD
jgi:hypothetical protein